MREIPVQLLPALDCPPALRPRIPDWWRPKDADPSMTAVAAQEARQQQALREACAGPFDRDGRHRRTLLEDDGTPVHRIVEVAPGYVYTYDPRSDPRRGRITYRYDPAASSQHRAAMRAVEEAYAAHSPEYVARATGKAVSS